MRLLALLLCLLSLPTLAQDYKTLRDNLKQQDDKLWAAMPLIVKKALFVEDEPRGYGLYTPRESNSFTNITPLNVYFELEGFGYGQVKDLYRLDMALDFVLKRKDGQEVLSQENFNTIATVSRNPSKEFYAHVAFNFTGLANGVYSLTTKFRDKITAKSTSYELEFKIEQ
jgi:hypothetical protein